MKAILFLAVLVFAAQSSQLHEIYRGFVSKLPMETEFKNYIMNSGLECLNQADDMMIKFANSLNRDIRNKNYFEILKDIILAEDTLEHKVAPQCIQTYQMIAMYFMEHKGTYKLDNNYRMDTPDMGMSMMMGNSFLYSSKLIQTLARALEDVAYNRLFNAGEKIATFFATGFGVIPADLPKLAAIDWQRQVPYDEERFFNEFISAFLKELGANQFQVNGAVACTKDLVNVTRNALMNPNLHRGDHFTAVIALLEGAMAVTESLERCAHTVDLSGVERVFELFLRYPIQFFLKTNINVILEQLTVSENNLNYGTHIRNGDYALAGKALATIIKIEFKDIAF